MNQPRVGAVVLSVLVAVGLLGMPSGVSGQDVVGQVDEVVANAPTPRVAGTAAEFVRALNPFAAQPYNQESAGALDTSGITRFCIDSCTLQARADEVIQ
jgi:hypothetical protein